MTLDRQKKNGSLIHIKDMAKVYQMGDIEVHALRDLSLEVQGGEYLAIMGASGSGKSTLMNMIGLLDRPTSAPCFPRKPWPVSRRNTTAWMNGS